MLGLEWFMERDLHGNFRHTVDSPLLMTSLPDIKWQSSHNQQHMLLLYQGPIILSQQTGSLQQVTSCPWSISGSQLLEPAWWEWQPRSEGRALAGTPAALFKDQWKLNQEPSLSCFPVVNKPEITTIPYANSNINCVVLPSPLFSNLNYNTNSWISVHPSHNLVT